MVGGHDAAIGRRWVGVVVVVVLLTATYVIVPMLPAPRRYSLRLGALYLSTLWYVALVAVAFERLSPIVWLAPRRIGMSAVAVVVLAVIMSMLRVPVASDVAKLAGALLVGAVLGRAIQQAWWLVPGALVITIADVWSVLTPHGVTHRIIEQAPSVVPIATVDLPYPGAAWAHGTFVGVSDFLFLAMFLCCGTAWALGVRRLVVVAPVGFVATIVINIELMNGAAVPALPMLSLAMLCAFAPGLWQSWKNERARRPK